MIIVGGFNTYPAEIENFYNAITTSPSTGPKAGEALTPQDVIAFGRDNIANFKVPKHVEIVADFPLTGSGKVQKFKQRQWAIDKYGFTSLR